MSLPTITVESMLLGWRESHNGGAQITLQLAPDDLEPFKSMTIKKGKIAGQRLMAVFVEIGDDENPVAQEVAAPEVTPEEPPKPPLGPLAQWAVMRCKDPVFGVWLCNRFPAAANRAALAGARNEEDTRKAVLCDVCGIDSRRELDTDTRAAGVFHSKIRKPWSVEHAEG